MKIAVVYNRDSKKVINLFGQPNLEKIGLKLVKRITDSLKSGGHNPISLEGDKNLVDRLEDFMPRVLKGERPGMVFNISYGIQGQARYTHVPSILEMVGIPYVGSGPLAHSIALDKVVTKMILVQHGLPTPGFAVLDSKDFEMPDLKFPLIVKPKNEAVSFGIKVVRSEKELREAADAIFEHFFGQPVLAERFIEGREINVGLLGNGPPDALPACELGFGEGETVYSYEDKTGRSGRQVELICPAPIGNKLAQKAQTLARKAFSAIGCYDCARVDMRLDENGDLYILEINSLPSLGEHGSYVHAAATVGLDFPKLVNRLVEVASARYFGTPAPPDITPRTRKDPTTAAFSFLTERRDLMEKRLAEWTRRPSRTSDPLGMSRVTRDLVRILTEIKMKPVADLSDGRAVHAWETRKGLQDGTLLLWHMDIPLERDASSASFRREPEWLFGEGIGVSRAPLVMAEFVLRALRNQRVLRNRRLGVCYYLDEGRDCRYSADLVRNAMAQAKRVVVLRPGGPGGTAYTQRRGQRRYRLVVEGEPIRPGKATKKPEVMLWFARKLDAISKLGSRKERLSVSLIDLKTDEFPMLLPHRITATLLTTYANSAAANGAENRIEELLGRDGPSWELETLSDRPPMRDRRGNKSLYKALAETAEKWDIPFKSESSVWPSVAGLAPASTQVVCGLGPVATDLYTPHEAVQRISLLQRTLLLTEFLLEQQ